MKKVLNKYREFARYIDKEIKVGKGADWCCWVEDKKICVPRAVVEQADKAFIESIRKVLPNDKKDLADRIPEFSWSFLHEVGHIQKGKRINDFFPRWLANTFGKWGFEKIANLIYFNLKEERLATQWAVDYAVNHFEVVKKFTNELVRTYDRYYKSIDIRKVLEIALS